jgi:pyruvate-formate lyase-activating enzyme
MLNSLFADERGEIFDAPGWGALGQSGAEMISCDRTNMIPLPPGSELMYLPGRTAMGIKRNGKVPMGRARQAVAAILPVGYTRLLLPVYERRPGAPVLPLFGYTAAAWGSGQIWVAAMQSDENGKWDPAKYNGKDLKRRVTTVRKALPENRLVEHLAHCSLEWHCCTAQNLFYHRWEAGIPTSQTCNANCLGCISLQPAECCPSPQSRIEFSPSVEEVAAVSFYHLNAAPDAIISFGQGCEGEPALAADTIAAAIRQVRQKTSRGVFNINTNAGYTEGIRQIVDAGIDSLRVSLISAREETHQAYYRSSYSLEAVRASIRYAKQNGCHVSINMLLFPGLNDQPDEVAAWEEFLRDTGADMIQLRNLNMDPDELRAALPFFSVAGIGIPQMVRQLQEALPSLRFGSFSHFRP